VQSNSRAGGNLLGAFKTVSVDWLAEATLAATSRHNTVLRATISAQHTRKKKGRRSQRRKKRGRKKKR
jgi:hypothetical protein